MNALAKTLPFLTTLALLLPAGCDESDPDFPGEEEGGEAWDEGGPENGPNEPDAGDDRGDAEGDDDDDDDDGLAEVPPSGALMVFVTNELSSDSGHSPVGGGVSWDHEENGVLRWVEGSDELAVITTEHSASYGYGDLLSGITIGDDFYRFNSQQKDGSACAYATCGEKSLIKMDPITGEVLGQCQAVHTDGWRFGFAVVDGSVFYRSAVDEDIWGDYIGGGALMRDHCDGSEPEFMAPKSFVDTYGVFGTGDRLYAKRGWTSEGEKVLVELDPDTLEELRTLPSPPVEDPFELEWATAADGLYVFEEVGSWLTVYAYDEGEDAWAELFAVETAGEGYNTLDGDRGDVLLTVRSGPAAGAYFFEAETGDVRQIDLPFSFMHSHPNGAGEFMRAP